MADSLNTGIQKLGDTLSAKLFGSSKENPEGSGNFSGVYFGPGGGVTRTDSFTIDGNRYGAAFLPVGYFDKTNQWVSGIMSDIIKTLPGVSKTPSDNVEQKFPQSVTDGRTGFEIKYSGEGGLYKHVGNGFIPPGFFDPNTKLWYDARLSLLIPEFPPGIHRTEGLGVFGPQQLEDLDNPENGLKERGFTPVAYFRTGKEIFIGQKNIENNVGVVTYDEAHTFSKKYGTDGFFDSALSPDYSFKYSLEDEKKYYSEDLTPTDNEDPLFVGFEIIIDQPNSPLFNGEIVKFIKQFKNNAEIESRGSLFNEMAALMKKLFRFNGPVKVYGQSEFLFDLTAGSRMHYIKKIAGLNKLVEANTPSAQSAFVKYRQDLITLSFYEDTTLNLGTLASLYKLLYWSRINGKNIIPENLLRFDCQIIVSEVRNLSRIVKTVNAEGADVFQTLKENVSRYVYNLYECQLFFDKMTHGDSVDLGGGQPAPVDNYDVSFSYKFSTMRFERFNFGSYNYRSIDNLQKQPQKKTPITSDSAFVTDGGIQPTNTIKFRPLRNGYSGKDLEDDSTDIPNWSIVSDSRPNRGFINTQLDDINSFLSDPNLTDLKQADKYRIYSNAFNKSVPEVGNQNMNYLDVGGMMGGGANGAKGDSENEIKGSIGSVLKDAGKNLLQNVKKAALNEAQRQLNNQFRLVNNSLDKIRNSFGIGRIPPPTNVYDSPPGGQFFFDVQNSLRNFGGDVLGGILGG